MLNLNGSKWIFNGSSFFLYNCVTLISQIWIPKVRATASSTWAIVGVILLLSQPQRRSDSRWTCWGAVQRPVGPLRSNGVRRCVPVALQPFTQGKITLTVKNYVQIKELDVDDVVDGVRQKIFMILDPAFLWLQTT